jgi:hypothetical protein
MGLSFGFGNSPIACKGDLDITMRRILIADSHYFDQYGMLGQRQYSLQFANHGWDVAYITNPLTPLNTIFGRDKRHISIRLLNHIKSGVNIKDHLWYYVPFTLVPFHNNTVFDRQWFFDNYYRFMVPPIKSVIKSKGFSSVDVLWLGTSHQSFWQDILDYKCCIYRLADYPGGFQGDSDITVTAMEQIIQSSDFILVTSKVLLRKYKSRFPGKEFIYCPNGVDLSNFVRNQYHRPEEYERIHSRIALYVGAIGEWFDQQLLVNIAKLCPEIVFVIIGVDRHGKMKGISQRNIHYLGPRYHEEIPNYIYYCDCGIIPFNNSKLVQTISPIKMYEFFALGKPVVSRAWEELRLLNSPCLLANDATQFADILKDKGTFTANHEELVDYAKQNTWHKRYLKIIKALERYGIQTTT